MSTIFALDIGTRKIAGLLMEQEGQKYIVHHVVIKEQLPNAMQDGQIHDIPKVAQTIREVVAEISAYTSLQITEAVVAAAGRSLRTQRGQSTIRLPLNQEITGDMLGRLELSAVQDALANMNQYRVQTAVDTYLCVGYSVVQSYLDDQPIQNLLGHQGYSASVEVIATFLPRIVVDSLMTALRLAGLEIQSLTLEPIAAMHAVIPQSMRMLNLALVDVGAGTSDIAITADGTVKAFGMIPQAGDLITKIIADHYLLDFMEAERAKRQLNSGSIVECFDVLGNRLQIDCGEVLSLIQPAVASLAHKISNEISALNDGPPKGVILIGGGSLTPHLDREIARYLQLPDNLVRVRDRASLANIKGADDYLGPQLVTPISIGCNHLDQLAMKLQKVTINGKTVHFLRISDATIGDALLNAGYDVDRLVNHTARCVDIMVNQKPCTIRGHSPAPVRILCNGEPAALQSKLQDQDTLEISIVENAEASPVLVSDLVQQLKLAKRLMINGRHLTIIPPIVINGQEKPLDCALADGDKAAYTPVETVADALRQAGIDSGQNSIVVYVNDQRVQLDGPASVMVNGKPGHLSQPIRDGDRIECQPQAKAKFILADIFRVYQPHRMEDIKQIKFWINDQPAGYTDEISGGDRIRLEIDHKN
ncbi:MAG: cell division FtsA domain-containing protein [Limnochordia bacterium]|jgi:cell division protein FtsA|nr:cell division FtsA domain-containing protein [Bacillota bacterium]HPT93906.1 cell division FtsA domain-containing protein [Limnochordia bacterium]